ncbi:MAG: hypothetical protein IPL27_15495 [Lewinellaceae bacterium]|nr:hypothetical protein [Lewinellaceae bacterium]
MNTARLSARAPGLSKRRFWLKNHKARPADNQETICKASMASGTSQHSKAAAKGYPPANSASPNPGADAGSPCIRSNSTRLCRRYSCESCPYKPLNDKTLETPKRQITASSGR